MLPHWIEIDEASPSEDEAAAQAALRLPEAQGLIHAIRELRNAEYLWQRSMLSLKRYAPAQLLNLY
jgi:hypothetical protein